MRKSLAIWIILMALGVGAVVTASKSVAASGTQVEINGTAIYGDEAEAEGIVLESSVVAGSNSKLRWDTRFAVGSEELPETVFTYNAPYRSNVTWRDGGVFLSTYPNITGSGSYGDFSGYMNLYGMEDVLSDVASRTEAGETHEEQIYLNDYMNYWLISVNIIAHGFNVVWDWDRWEDRLQGDNREAVQKLLDNVRVPVQSNTMMEVTIGKDANGSVNHFSFDALEDAVWVSSLSVEAGDKWYFIAYYSGEDGREYPAYHGEYGIYSLAYARSESSIIMDKEGPQLAIPLAEDQLVMQMMLDEEEENLLFITREDENIMLTVFDLETLTTRQRLKLIDRADGEAIDLIIRSENLLIPVISPADFSDGTMVLLQRNEAGEYERQFAVRASYQIITEWKEQSAMALQQMTSQITVAYDGERLVVVTPVEIWVDGSGAANGDSCEFIVTVHDQNGLLYMGLYKNSLGIGEYYQANWCRYNGEIGVKIR